MGWGLVSGFRSSGEGFRLRLNYNWVPMGFYGGLKQSTCQVRVLWFLPYLALVRVLQRLCMVSSNLLQALT